jgi:hypothetical protein
MSDAPTFAADLEALGFGLVQSSRRGDQYALAATRYLTYWVHWNQEDGTCLFTWEVDIGELMHNRELQIGANETLNLFLFPQYDARGPADVSFVAQELDRAESILKSIDLTAG